MSSPDPRFALDHHLNRLYADAPRPLQLQATTPDTLYAWQVTARERLRELLGIADLPQPQVVHHACLGCWAYDGYTEEKHQITTDEGVVIPLYLLVPRTTDQHRALLVFHGHTPSVQYILGHFPDSATATEYRGRHGNYAQRLAQAGYLVCAVEQRSFGERQSSTVAHRQHPNSCRHQSFFYQMLGRTMVGERCRDGMAALHFLQERFGPTLSHIGITGNSGGGTTTLWLAALDKRFQVVVPGSYFCSFRMSVMDIHHCACNYVPSVAAELEMGDLAALVAPRPMRFVQGVHDPIFPFADTQQQFRTVTRAYQILDARQRVDLAAFPTEHAYHVPFAVDWFDRWL